jgi:hypothetical protein
VFFVATVALKHLPKIGFASVVELSWLNVFFVATVALKHLPKIGFVSVVELSWLNAEAILFYE